MLVNNIRCSIQLDYVAGLLLAKHWSMDSYTRIQSRTPMTGAMP